jgi:hypothetical protein
MSNVIRFLERLGTDAQLRHASDGELEQAMIGAQIDPAIRDALLRRDQRRLEELLGANANVCCMIFVPAQEEPEEQEEDDDKEPDQEDGGEEKAIRLTAR